MRSAGTPVVAYLLATFPTLTETFVVGEIVELRRQGIPIDVYALGRAAAPLASAEAQALAAETTFARAPWTPAVFGASARWALRRPGRYFGTLVRLLGAAWRNPVHLAKTLFLFAQAAELADRMRERGVGHVHAHWATYPTTVALVVSRLTGLPFSFTAHAWDVSLIRTLLDVKLRAARFVVTCTDENRQYLAGRLPAPERDKVHLNYHGIALERFPRRVADAPSGALTITACGTLFERKGLADLVRACAILAGRGHDFHCVVIGEGPQRPVLEALVRDLGLGERVRLTGALSQFEVIRWYERTDIFALPCLARRVRLRDPEADWLKSLEAWLERGTVIKDGIPNVLAEVMAMGIPVVSTALAGIPELIQHEENGLLVPPRDPARLAAALERLLTDGALRRRLGDTGAADVRTHFDRRENTQALVSIFTRALEASGPGAPARAGARPSPAAAPCSEGAHA